MGANAIQIRTHCRLAGYGQERPVRVAYQFAWWHDAGMTNRSVKMKIYPDFGDFTRHLGRIIHGYAMTTMALARTPVTHVNQPGWRLQLQLTNTAVVYRTALGRDVSVPRRVTPTEAPLPYIQTES